jgi:hypothetical protein
MDAISKKDAMTPDHIPSGAAVVVACYLSDKNKEEDLPARISDSYVYDKKTNPSPRYDYVYSEANTIVYDTAIHQKSSPTYGGRNKRDVIIADAKNLKRAFADNRGIVEPALIASQKKRDANHKPPSVSVTRKEVEADFDRLNSLNTSSDIYSEKGLKKFCKK